MGRTHGMSGTPTHRIWKGMVSRCANPKIKNYGARGITVCKRWRVFVNFFADMGPRPCGKSLDRIDNNKGYYAGNCRWATPKEQARNTRINVLIEYDGKKMCLDDWALESGIQAGTIRNRIHSGWTVKDALTAPAGSRPRSLCLLTFNAKTMRIGLWAKTLGFKSPNTIRMRIKSGWPLEKALTIPKSGRIGAI